jgi:hypothetical protein
MIRSEAEVTRLAPIASLLVAIGMTAPRAAAQTPITSGVVVDQTGLPLPGATVQLREGDRTVASTTTAGDGHFEFDSALDGDAIAAALDGFEPTVVPRSDAARIVLLLAHTTATTTVVAPAFVEESATTASLGSHLTASTLARLPSSHMKAKESLPLLPSVIRGADGLLRVGGARPYETPLLIDGFNVTDPATGVSNINLPFEAVGSVDVLRDPMAASYGGLIGGVMQLDSKAGGDAFRMGVQGFVPRPRFASPGFGRLEGIFHRVYAGGAAMQRRVRYFATVEYDFERIPVPGVTQGAGPDIVEQSTTMFGRLDVQPSDRQALTLEALAFPAATTSAGLSPRREQPATANNHSSDVFVGLTDRFVFADASVLTMKGGVVTHDTTITPNGSGIAYLSPQGWRGNWFASVDRRAIRYTVTVNWDRTIPASFGTHALTMGSSVTPRRLSGTVFENPVVVENSDGQTVRSIDFGPGSTIRARDARISGWLRDAWRASDRAELDLGVRVDENLAIGGMVPSGRAGLRYALDKSGLTVLKAGVGRFVGVIPLAVQAFAGYPAASTERSMRSAAPSEKSGCNRPSETCSCRARSRHRS